MKQILVLCTGNSCRSQMAEGILKSFSNDIEVCSAGTDPAEKTASKAVIVMKEIGIDISSSYPKNVNIYLDKSFDYVITVCDSAKETCPVFTGKVLNRLHIGFDDPWQAVGSEEEILAEYRRVRDEILREFKAFFDKYLA